MITLARLLMLLRLQEPCPQCGSRNGHWWGCPLG